MRVYDGSNCGNGRFVCDKCNKTIEKWQVQQIILRQYSPGENHNKVSSDISISFNKIADLCPECMTKLISQI